MEVASTDFGTAAAAEDGEQTVHAFTLSFDSDDYDSSTGFPDYMNGEHSIQALLKVAGRDGHSCRTSCLWNSITRMVFI